MNLKNVTNYNLTIRLKYLVMFQSIEKRFINYFNKKIVYLLIVFLKGSIYFS